MLAICRRASDTPSASSISGMVTPPTRSSVLASQAGTGVCVAMNGSDSATA
ncbi:hypothetical protein D3C83_272510 [compost metagenome]